MALMTVLKKHWQGKVRAVMLAHHKRTLTLSSDSSRQPNGCFSHRSTTSKTLADDTASPTRLLLVERREKQSLMPSISIPGD